MNEEIKSRFEDLKIERPNLYTITEAGLWFENPVDIEVIDETRHAGYLEQLLKFNTFVQLETNTEEEIQGVLSELLEGVTPYCDSNAPVA